MVHYNHKFTANIRICRLLKHYTALQLQWGNSWHTNYNQLDGDQVVIDRSTLAQKIPRTSGGRRINQEKKEARNSGDSAEHAKLREPNWEGEANDRSTEWFFILHSLSLSWITLHSRTKLAWSAACGGLLIASITKELVYCTTQVPPKAL